MEVKDLALRLQSAVDEVVEWTASKISPSLLINYTSPSSRRVHTSPEVSLPNPDNPSGATMLKLNRRPEILGVILDTRLTFPPHMKAVAAKGRAKLNIMRALTATSRGSSKETNRIFVRLSNTPRQSGFRTPLLPSSSFFRPSKMKLCVLLRATLSFLLSTISTVNVRSCPWPIISR